MLETLVLWQRKNLFQKVTQMMYGLFFGNGKIYFRGYLTTFARAAVL